MYNFIDAIVRFVFEAVLYVLPISRETLDRWRRYYILSGIYFVFIAFFVLLGLIVWVNFQ